MQCNINTKYGRVWLRYQICVLLLCILVHWNILTGIAQLHYIAVQCTGRYWQVLHSCKCTLEGFALHCTGAPLLHCTGEPTCWQAVTHRGACAMQLCIRVHFSVELRTPPPACAVQPSWVELSATPSNLPQKSASTTFSAKASPPPQSLKVESNLPNVKAVCNLPKI